MKRKRIISDEERAGILEQLRRSVSQREAGYRGRALAMSPHICASCGREFEGKRLKELTVHHKDHNHDNNPPDGSNWELLCIYCHDHEHEKNLMAGHGGGGDGQQDVTEPSIFNQLEGLDSIMRSAKGSDTESKKSQDT